MNESEHFIDRMRKTQATDNRQDELDLFAFDKDASPNPVIESDLPTYDSEVSQTAAAEVILDGEPLVEAHGELLPEGLPLTESDARADLRDEASGDLRDAPQSEVQGESSQSSQAMLMPAEARRALVSLMRQGVVLASRKARVFDALVEHEKFIRRHLSEVYLQLVLDERAGVAFVASLGSSAGGANTQEPEGSELDAPDEDADTVSLITQRTLSLYDTLLLLVLRKHYQEREVAGEQRIIIDIERAESGLIPFLPLTNSERNDRRKLTAALSKMVEKRLLTRVRGSDERYEITPVIRYVVSAEFLESLLKEYERLAVEATGESENTRLLADDEDSEQVT